MSFHPTDEVIARAIIALSHSLNMKVIAEGVEKKDQISFLRSLKCDEVQGNIISRPLTNAEVANFLIADKRLKHTFLIDNTKKRRS